MAVVVLTPYVSINDTSFILLKKQLKNTTGCLYPGRKGNVGFEIVLMML